MGGQTQGNEDPRSNQVIEPNSHRKADKPGDDICEDFIKQFYTATRNLGLSWRTLIICILILLVNGYSFDWDIFHKSLLALAGLIVILKSTIALINARLLARIAAMPTDQRERLLGQFDASTKTHLRQALNLPEHAIAEPLNSERKKRKMKGTILDFSIQTNTGIISGEDGKRYSFTGAEWKDSAHPAKGMSVDFEPKENFATGIYVMPGIGCAPVATLEAKRPPEYQGFYKSTDDKMLAGVCGGLAHKLNVSPVGLRVVFVIAGLLYLIGVFIYVVLWLIFKGVPTKNVKFTD